MTPRIFSTNSARSTATIAALLAAAACFVAMGNYAAVGQMHFYQHRAPEAVMLACGEGFRYPTLRPQPLVDFLSLKASSFSCDQLVGVTAAPPSTFALLHYWLYVAIGSIWKVLGVSYAALVPMQALGHAAYVLGVFTLARLYFSLTVSAIVGAAFAFSAIATAMLPFLRDYFKAPFIVWGLVALICLVRARGTARAAAYGLALGLIIGFGRGFRTDVAVLLAGAVPALLIATFARAPTAWVRIAPVLLFGVGLFAGMLPNLNTPATSRLGQFAMQGWTSPFERHMQLRRASYELGHVYADELVFSTLLAEQPSQAPEDDPHIELARARAASTSSFLHRYVLLFPADTVMRAAKTATLLMGFYPMLRREVARHDPQGVYPGVYSVSRVGAQLINVLVIPWMLLLIFPGFVILFTAVALRDKAEATMLAIALLALMTAPSLQFSMRHAFHLEWLPWLGTLGYAFLPGLWRDHRRALVRGAQVAAGLGALIAVTWIALAAYQHIALTREVTALISAPRENVPITRTDAGANVVLSVPPPASRPIPESVALSDEIRKTHRIYERASRRLLLRIGGPQCDAQQVNIATVYEQRRPGHSFAHKFLVPVPDARHEEAIVIIPVYYYFYQVFQSLQVAADEFACVRSVELLADTTALPASFAAMLQPDWQRRRLYVGFGRL